MTTLAAREIHLASRPHGRPALDNFVEVEARARAPLDDEVRVRNLWMSVDPYMGNRLYDRPNYIPPFRLDHVLDGGAIGIVLDSEAPGFEAGDLVFSQYGWRDLFTAKSKRLTKLPPSQLPPQAHLGIAGVTGMTAYTALFRIARMEGGETVYVSAAAGAVGIAACQMAKLHGCRVVASAGGAEKKLFLEQLGVDIAIDYKAEADLAVALSRAAPEGIDIYLDNVGGGHLQAALANMALFGRIAVSGMIGSYGDAPEPGPSNLFQIVARRLRVEGFLLNDHEAEIRGEFLEKMAGWSATGQLRGHETIYEGLAKAPDAFIDLFSGKNIGKMIIKID